MAKKKEVQKFLERFHSADNVDVIFTQGCCYWFAVIMAMRFHAPVMYDQVGNHFTVKIHSRLYDITGDVTDKYPDSMEWRDYMEFDRADFERVVRDCVMF